MPRRRTLLLLAPLGALLLVSQGAPASATSTTGAAAAPVQVVSSPDDALQLGSRLVFSTVVSEARPARSIRVSNLGASALTIGAIRITGPQAADFALADGQATHLTIGPGGSAPVSVRYVPKSGGAGSATTHLSAATLQIAGNDPARPSTDVALSGYNARGFGGVLEPSLQEVFTTLGYSDAAGVSNYPKHNSLGPASTAVGNEVLTPYWTRADATKPVTLLPLAHTSSQATTYASAGWFERSSGAAHFLYAFRGGPENDGWGQNQMLLPGTTSSAYSFVPPGSFGVADSQGNRSDDLRVPNGHWHNIRSYPAKSTNGTTIPDTWIVADDIGAPQFTGAKNWDYQDYVFLLTNARPDPTASAPLPGAMNRALRFDGGAGGVLGTGFDTTQAALDPTKVSLAGGRLRVRTSDDSNTNHTNALQLRVDAGSRLRVQSRLVGPFSAIDAGAEQQAIFFGPDSQNYLKAELEWNAASHQRRITIWKEQSGSGAIVASVALPGGNASSVDLRIDVTPSSYTSPPSATVAFAVNGSTAFTTVGTTTVLPRGWITATTPAGIMTSNQQGGAPFDATYEDFVVSRR